MIHILRQSGLQLLSYSNCSEEMCVPDIGPVPVSFRYAVVFARSPAPLFGVTVERCVRPREPRHVKRERSAWAPCR